MFSLDDTVAILTRGKERFGISPQSIAVGSKADLSLFSPTGSHKVSKASLLSTAKNSLFLGQTLAGTVYGVIAKNTLQIQTS